MRNEEIKKEIQFFISYLYLKHPFYNSLISSINLELEDTEDSNKYGIYSFNNDNIKIDIEFAKKQIKEDKKLFFYYIIHELLHIILKHKTRQLGREKKKWDICADIVIDSVVKKDKVLKDIIKTPEDKRGVARIYDSKNEVSTSVEKLYSTINIKEEKCEQSEKKSNKGEETTKNCQNETGDNQKGKKTEDGFLDNHNWEVSSIEKEENKINEKIIKAYQFVEMTKGSKKNGGVPGTFLEIINELKQPTTNILDYITKIIQTYKKYSTTYKRGDRRYLYNKLIVPSKTKDIKHFKLLFYIDTSGSASIKELTKVMSEIHYIVKSLKSYQIDIVQSDAGISDIYTIKDKDQLDIKKFLEIKGRGGTEMKPLFELLKESKYDYTIVSSDYYISQEEQEGLKELSKEIEICYIATENSKEKYIKELSPLFKL